VNAAVITVSDSCHSGTREDGSGPRVAERLRLAGFDVSVRRIVPDEMEAICSTLRSLAAEVPLIVTTGGTGIAARDVTPEATRAVCERILEGFGERMRREGERETPLAALSRAVSGSLGRCLIVNVPGSPRGAVQSLEAVLHLIPHALSLLAGDTFHPEEPDAARDRSSAM
jgi:molybdopterin adenylyltransferase